MDRVADRHRCADHPGNLQLRFRAALRNRPVRLGLFGILFSRNPCDRAVGRALGNGSGAVTMQKAVTAFAKEPARDIPVVATADVVVVGGGPAGFSAGVAAARNGASVCLVERYPYLGGLASGGMVLVLDDMCAGAEITVRGLCQEVIERLVRRGLAVYPPEQERGHDPAMWRKWSRWGLYDFNVRTRPHPICYAAAFDPDGWKRVSDEMVAEAGVDLRLHSWFSHALVRDGAIEGVVVDSKAGRQAIMGGVVIDATGDLDV